jgi:hypothetical protein
MPPLLLNYMSEAQAQAQGARPDHGKGLHLVKCTRTTQLNDRRRDEVRLDEVERITI